MSLTKIKFITSYDGTNYCGWQRQNHGPLKSVAHTIEDVLSKLFNEKIGLYASGRTDAGVHALNQVCHFETHKTPEHFEKWDFCWAMKSQLPPSIVIKSAWVAPSEFHSTLSATHKTYRYQILNRPRGSPFLDRYADWIRRPLDLKKLQLLTDQLVGTHDFKSFQSVGSDVTHTVRQIYKAKWSYRNSELVQFRITGSGFLKQMVRNIVGTALMLERQGLGVEEMQRILQGRERRLAGPPAPPQGLFLERVYYPKELDNRCREL